MTAPLDAIANQCKTENVQTKCTFPEVQMKQNILLPGRSAHPDDMEYTLTVQYVSCILPNESS